MAEPFHSHGLQRTRVRETLARQQSVDRNSNPRANRFEGSPHTGPKRHDLAPLNRAGVRSTGHAPRAKLPGVRLPPRRPWRSQRGLTACKLCTYFGSATSSCLTCVKPASSMNFLPFQLFHCDR